MGEKIVIGSPFNRGLRKDVTPFNIDNDSFPTLINAYQWRGRIKRKRGTSFLGRLQRYANLALANTVGAQPFYDNNELDIRAGVTTAAELNPQIVPGTVVLTINDAAPPSVFSDAASHGFFTKISGTLVLDSGNPQTIDYSTGQILLSFTTNLGVYSVSVSFLYNPLLPVMGLRDFISTSTQFPGTIAFDPVYAYNITPTSPYPIYDVSYYKNPPTGTYTNYVQKAAATALTWNGNDYQQFWTVNYQGSMWTTNGVAVPFVNTNIGMQFKDITNILVTSAGPPAVAVLTIVAHGLVQGDFLFINEVDNIGVASAINLQTGYVTSADPQAANTVTVTFPNATMVVANYITDGIAQYLTNRSDITKDCIRWYDGDPTNGSATSPIINGMKGWVNFCPPLSQSFFPVGDNVSAQYYLIGAKIIVPFKDRLLFLGPVIQTSSPNSQIYLKDTIIFSQSGTPYYTASFTGSVTSSSTIFNPILTPNVGTSATIFYSAAPNAWFEDITGFGGSDSAGVDQAINTVGANEDNLIIGFDRLQTRLVYSGNDLVPFNFFIINSELGSSSTFSAITLDQGVMSRGSRGYLITSQVNSQRIDLEIPDQVFEQNITNNGPERITAYRDFINEWVYFTYNSNQSTAIFPNQTLKFNYRDNSWALFDESYTTYGTFRRQTGYTWATIGDKYATWSVWNAAWNAGASTLLNPEVIAGNQQGFVMVRDSGTGEQPSLYITAISFPSTIISITLGNPTIIGTINEFVAGQNVTISGVVGTTQLNGNTYEVLSASSTDIEINVDSTLFTAYVSGGLVTPTATVYSPNHTLNDGDFIVISGALGTIAANVNGKIFLVDVIDLDNFNLSPDPVSGTYTGGGVITRMYVPQIQTKQFPVAWDMARKTRIGPQQYLLTTTPNGQITLQIFLSQNASNAYNEGFIVPNPNTDNSALIYSQVLYTCPESTNLGLTAANVNLQMPTAIHQDQIWHRVNTSLLGDTIQLGFTLSEAQMRDVNFNNQMTEIELHSIVIDVQPSQVLA